MTLLQWSGHSFTWKLTNVSAKECFPGLFLSIWYEKFNEKVDVYDTFQRHDVEEFQTGGTD